MFTFYLQLSSILHLDIFIKKSSMFKGLIQCVWSNQCEVVQNIAKRAGAQTIPLPLHNIDDKPKPPVKQEFADRTPDKKGNINLSVKKTRKSDDTCDRSCP